MNPWGFATGLLVVLGVVGLYLLMGAPWEAYPITAGIALWVVAVSYAGGKSAEWTVRQRKGRRR
jgi:hypothetical protein